MVTQVKGIVRGSTDPKEFNGEMQLGFTLTSDAKKWYNIAGEEADLKIIKEKTLKKGGEITFNLEGSKVKELKLIAEPKEEDHGDMLDFEKLLKDAHNKELTGIQTQIISIDTEKKIAVFKAIAIGKKGTFEAHGDADETNVGDMVKKHWIRMAETRAICRALRWYTNNAACSEEEKGE